MAKTLDELKAENAAEEARLAAEVQEQEVEEQQPDEGTDEVEQVAETEAWMQEETEEQASDGGAKAPKFTSDDMRNMRLKLQSKVKERDEELEKLKAQIEQLSQQRTQPQTQSSGVPTLEQFEYDEAKYQAAMQAWLLSQVDNVTKSKEAQARQEQVKQRFDQQVEGHYERAALLVKERGIDPELYKSADHALRSTMEQAFPGKGDLVTNEFLARIGDGSEKVAYYLGRNVQQREILKAKLLDDPTGLSASLFLGSLLGKVSEPPKKHTRAPDPAPRADGGESMVSDEVALRKRYVAEKDTQKRFEIRMQAKRSGYEVSKW